MREGRRRFCGPLGPRENAEPSLERGHLDQEEGRRVLTPVKKGTEYVSTDANGVQLARRDSATRGPPDAGARPGPRFCACDTTATPRRNQAPARSGPGPSQLVDAVDSRLGEFRLLARLMLALSRKQLRGMTINETEITSGGCRHCWSRAVLAWQVTRADDGKSTDRRLIRIQCSNPLCPSRETFTPGARSHHG